RGEERLAAITVGTHGVKVVRGAASGLFLPSVAVEGNWDAARLLDQVCVKAGLPPIAWRDDDTALFTFEGEAIRARLCELGARNSERGTGAPRSEFRAPTSDIRVYADFCRDNLALLLTGRVPNYFLMSAPDGNVSGVALSLRRPNVPQPLSFLQLSLRHGVPLQTTLFNLTQAAAQQLASERITLETLSGIQAGVTILNDPVLHGTVADP